MIKDIRGMLAEHTLKMIIAIIVILGLVYLLVALYFGVKETKSLEQAEASVNNFTDAVNTNKTSLNFSKPATNGLAPFVTHWWFFIWPNDEVMPNSCLNLGWENCACICGIKSYGGITMKGASEACDERGICRELKEQFTLNGERKFGIFEIRNAFEINNPPVDIEINYETNRILVNKN